MNSTPRANRLHIGLFGRRNSGKSSLLNVLTGQRIAVVSPQAGTTTDPVYQAMEVAGVGPCVFIDTAGFDDEGELGALRVSQTEKVAEKCDIALMVCADARIDEELRWIARLRERDVPVILILNGTDRLENPETTARKIEERSGSRPICVSAIDGRGIDEIRGAIVRAAADRDLGPGITEGLAEAGDVVLLVMPQDLQAPKGRLILPQVQTLRDLLDRGAVAVCCTTDKLKETLAALTAPPKLIITDSQVFRTVWEQKPKESRLTSFSVLFARYKGDMACFRAGAERIGQLTPSSRVLIAEACTHVPMTEDIGRVKLPAMLRRRVGQGLRIDIVSGADFPQDLTPYDLVIQCGACMFNRRHVLNRVAQAGRQGVPMTNYGVAIAYLSGILNDVTY